MNAIKLNEKNKAQVQTFLKQYGNSALQRAISQYREANPLSTGTMPVIDLQPALDGKNQYQKDWINFYNKQEGKAKNKRMILASDVYRAGNSKSKELLASLRKDFDDSVVVSGTRNLYNKDNLAGKIVHNFNSTIAKPIELAVAEIPVYKSENVKNVVEGKGLAYAQALFQTKDKSAKIIDTLETLSQKGAEDIRFWTPDQSSRKNNSERAVWFDCGDDGFRVDGDDWGWDDVYSGRSRGVLLDSAKRSR